jgi:hypothetical protein
MHPPRLPLCLCLVLAPSTCRSALVWQVVIRGVAAMNGRILLPGCFFGVDMVLANRKLRDLTDAIAMTFTQIQVLSADDLQGALAVFPKVRAGPP